MHHGTFGQINVRRAAVTCAVALAAFSASGARLYVPGLRDQMRAVPAARLQTRRATEANVRATPGAAHVGARARALVAALAWVFAFPFFVVLPALRGLAHGACAHDGSPKCRRGLSLGGHGRIGAG